MATERVPSIEELLHLTVERGASDLHIKPRRPPLIRINGHIVPTDFAALSPEEIGPMLLPLLRPTQKKKLEENLAVDLGYGLPGLARFRCNMYLQRGTLAASFRMIPYKISTLEELDLPTQLLELCEMPMGLVLVTGPTGSGKSTTLAALIQHISRRRPYHIISIEDPIEFLFRDDESTIAQREVGTDTPTFREALKNSLRQDPDVIMVGEMRDPDTVSTVMTAAETGHLVFSTLHTNDAPQTVDRILDNFPPAQQNQIRQQLSQVLKAVVSMQLVERSDGGRVAALEIMRISPEIERVIQTGETNLLPEQIESSVAHHRMQSMNQSLLALLVHGTITYDEARRRSADPDDLSLKLRNMFPRIEQRGTDMSTADFSEIFELRQFKKLYQEHEEKSQVQLDDKNKIISDMQERNRVLTAEIERLKGQVMERKEEFDRVAGEKDRVQRESQFKIDKLMERIKELNQRLVTKV